MLAILKRCVDELKARFEKYLKRGKPLFEKLRVIEISRPKPANGKKIYDMAMAYYRDAMHFYEKGEYVNALCALEYAEGWMDAGKEMGVLE